MIPKLHYIAEGNSSKEILENIQKACTSGAELIQLCLKNIAKNTFLQVAKEAREITAHYQTRLIINEHYKIAKEIKADGVHLEKTHVCPTLVREFLYTWQIIGASATTLQDCKKSIKKQVDYITLSPFRNSSSVKNLHKVLGINGFSLITEALQTETPIIGFGGITTEDIATILQTGVSGVAVSEAISNNFDNIKVFNQLLKASVVDEKRHTF